MPQRSGYGDGSITQSAPGRYRIRWSEGVDPFTGKHIRRHETIDAKNLTEARRELKLRTSRRHRPTRLTFGDLLDLTLPQLGISERTRETYGYALKHIPDVSRGWPAGDITVVQAKQVIDGLTKRHGAWMVRKIHAALMSCWKFAYESGWIQDNPWRALKMPAVSASAGLVLDDEEVARLRAACSDQMERVWIELHLDTGARPGEVTGLRWSAIDLEDHVVNFIDAKHDNAARPVAITPTIADLIRTWQQAQRERALAGGGGFDADPYLISNTTDSSVPWRVPYAGSYRWSRLRARAKLRDELRLYDLRHTHNSWLAAAGIDPTTRAERIGNSPATNMRTYSHSTQDRAAAAAIEARRQGSVS